jgi:hypothetical protein
VAVQDLAFGSVGGGGAVGVQDEAPAAAVDADVVVELAQRRVVRSQPAMPEGPETKSMASRAMAYRSAWAAPGVNRARARFRARDAARAPPPAMPQAR